MICFELLSGIPAVQGYDWLSPIPHPIANSNSIAEFPYSGLGDKISQEMATMITFVLILVCGSGKVKRRHSPGQAA